MWVANVMKTQIKSKQSSWSDKAGPALHSCTSVDDAVPGPSVTLWTQRSSSLCMKQCDLRPRTVLPVHSPEYGLVFYGEGKRNANLYAIFCC
jgi:hypothetical protein